MHKGACRRGFGALWQGTRNEGGGEYMYIVFLITLYYNTVILSHKILINSHLREGLFMICVNDLSTIDVMPLEIDLSLGKSPISEYSSVRREGAIDCFLALDLVYIKHATCLFHQTLNLKYTVWSGEVDKSKRPKVGT